MDDPLAFFVSSFIIASLYFMALIASLVAARCRYHFPAIVMTSAYLSSFAVKTSADALRYF